MLKKYIIFFIIVFFTNNSFAQYSNNGYKSMTEIFHEADNGIIINKSNDQIQFDEYNSDFIIEKYFINPFSGENVYYTGAEYRGNGVFWINNNGKRQLILETHIQYGAKIIWHSSNDIEIPIPTGSPFSHSYYYNIRENFLSNAFSFPVYYDSENKTVLIWGNLDFELYDIETSELLKTYNARRKENLTAGWPYISYYIIENDITIEINYYNYFEERSGRMIIELVKRINGA
jgi:hypothetical protein